MGHALLWIELLAGHLLFLAFMLACLGRVKRRWLRIVLGVLLYLLLLGPSISLVVTVAQLHFNRRVENVLFWHAASLTACYVLGALLLWWLAMRRTGEDDVPTCAARWPRVKLLVAWFGVVVLTTATLLTLDYFVRREMVDLRNEATELVQSVATPPLPEEENAADLYRQAFELMGTEEEQYAWPDVWERALDATDRQGYRSTSWQWEDEEAEPAEPFSFADPELAAFLHEHAEAMSLLHQAARRPDCNLGYDYSDPNALLNHISEISEFRQAARLLGIDARHKAAMGDYAGAMEDLNAIFGIARHAGDEPIVVWGLVSVAIQQMGVMAFEDVMAAGPVPEEALDHLDTGFLPDYRLVFHNAFIGEEAFGLGLFSGEELEMAGSDSSSSLMQELGPFYRVLMLRKDIEIYRGDMQKLQQMTERPFEEAIPAARTFQNNYSGSYFTYLLVPALTIALEGGQRGDAYGANIELALALYRYQARYHRMPETIEELVPEFLPEIPLDPHDGQLVRVQRGKEKWVVYCLGGDEDDDGGTPYDYDTKDGDLVVEVVVWPFEEEEQE